MFISHIATYIAVRASNAKEAIYLILFVYLLFTRKSQKQTSMTFGGKFDHEPGNKTSFIYIQHHHVAIYKALHNLAVK